MWTRNLLFLSVILVQYTTATTAQTCQNNIYVNGCSVPPEYPILYRDEYTPACNRHDVCYACAVSYGISRKDCDVAFKGDTNNYCKQLPWYQFKEKLNCKWWSFIYFLGVRILGQPTFNTNPSSAPWCQDAWVSKCLPSK